MGMLNKLKYFIGLDDYEEDEDDIYEDEDLKVPISTKTKKMNNKVVNIHTNKNMKLVIYEPLNYEEAPAIVDDLKSNKVVVINFEQLDTNLKRQIFDFLNGSIYSIDGKIQKVTKDIFILGPGTIEIDGLKNELKTKGIFPW